MLKEYCIFLLKSHSMILKLSQLIYMPVTRAETFHSLLNLHTIPWELFIWACDIDNSMMMFIATTRLWMKTRMLKAKAYFKKKRRKTTNSLAPYDVKMSNYVWNVDQFYQWTKLKKCMLLYAIFLPYLDHLLKQLKI